MNSTFTFFVTVIVVIACVGFGVWLLTTLWPMDPKYAMAIRGVAAVGLVLWILSALGIFNPRSIAPRGRVINLELPEGPPTAPLARQHLVASSTFALATKSS